MGFIENIFFFVNTLSLKKSEIILFAEIFSLGNISFLYCSTILLKKILLIIFCQINFKRLKKIQFNLFSLFVDAEDRLDVSFVQNKIFVGSELSLAAESIISQLFGFYSLLNSVRKYDAFDIFRFSHLTPLKGMYLNDYFNYLF